MELIDILLIVVHVIMAILLVIAILLQSGKGGGLGAGFGGASAAATQIFGGRGAGNFLSRSTVAFAAIFMCTSLGLAMRSAKPRTVLDLTETEGAVSSQEDTILEEGTGPELDLDAQPQEPGDAAPTDTAPADTAPAEDTASPEGDSLKLDLPKTLLDSASGGAAADEPKTVEPEVKPVEKPKEKPVEKPVEKPKAKKKAKPVEKTEAAPVEKKAEAQPTSEKANDDAKPSEPKAPAVKEAQ